MTRTDALRKVLPPAIVLVAFTGTWQAGLWNEVFGLGAFTLPKPLHILDSIRDESGTLLTHAGDTFLPAIIGFLLGNGLGFVLGLLLLALPAEVARRVSAVFLAVQALPIIATAPLVALYLGGGLAFKTAVVVIMAFPSMMVYSFRGMTNVDAAALELMASYNASGRQIFWRIRLPGALPYVFTAAKYTTVLALIGVVVCEVLRSRSGLGYEIIDALQSFRTPEAWAAVLILALAGITWYSLLGLVERRLFPWSVERTH